jgi:hypothetical protein
MIAYFTIFKSENEKYSGGLLIVNEKGLPLSFKYTTPIQPGKIQKIIFGNNLKSYLASEIIGKKLLSEEKELSFIFVDDSEIIEFVETDKNLLFLKETYNQSENHFKGTEGAIITSPNRGLKIQSSKEITSEIFEKIKNFSDYFDLYEPFSRLKEALSHICSSEEN